MKPIDNLHEEEFNILCQFKKYCNKYGLKYYLEGGTLLGAVRHKGFIPWDDDIDTIMPRNDYQKLLHLVEKEPISEDIVVITDENGYDFRKPYAKICNKKTLLYEGQELQTTGIFIDVFPIDGAANFVSEIKIRYFFMDCIKVLENYAWMSATEVRELSLSKRIRAYICRSIGTNFWRMWLKRIFTRYEFGKTKYVSQIAWSTLLVYNKTEEYMQQVEVEFEGEFFTAPACYDKRLRLMYGDYMKLPPEEQRKPKHSIVAYWKN